MPRDPYEVLGVSKSASADEIQKAYRKLSKKHHPDRNPGDKAADSAYKEVQEAYEILGDATKKARFDEYGFAGPPQGGFPGGGFQGGFPGGGFGGGFPGGGVGGPNIDPEMAEELFKRFVGGGGGMGGEGPDLGDLFGGGRRGRAKTRGRRQPMEPIEAEVSVPFDVAANGGSIGIQIGNDHIDVKIPAGIDDGKKLRVKGDDTRPRDVLLKVKIAPHPYFRREGNDILLDVPISVVEAILGGKVEVPTIGGERLEVKVRPGTSGGSRLRLRGKGINGGDQYLVFKLLVPPGEVDEASRKLIEEFAAKNPQTPRVNIPWA